MWCPHMEGALEHNTARPSAAVYNGPITSPYQPLNINLCLLQHASTACHRDGNIAKFRTSNIYL